MKKRTPRTIRLDRSGRDHMLPHDLVDILTRRFLPVIALTYVSSVIGIASEGSHPIHYIFYDKTAYIMALFVVLWVSVPAILWIFIRSSHLFGYMAGTWYKICALLMIALLAFSYVLFPEANEYGLRTYFAASVPLFFVMYYFFVKGNLPALAAHPLTALGFTFLLYGATINILH